MNTPRQKGMNLFRRFLNRCAKRYMYRLRLPAAYRESAKRPLDANKAVFVEVRRKELSNSLKTVYDRCVADGRNVSLHMLDYTHARVPRLLKNCLALMRDIGDAGCVFVDDTCEALGCFERRKGQKIIQVWHGCGAFKKFGFSTADMIFGKGREEMLRYPSHANYTLVPVSGKSSIAAYREAFGLGEDKDDIVRPMGVSRTDVFFDPQALSNARQKVIAAVPAADGKKIILYAPTFRGNVQTASAPQMPDLRLLKESLGVDCVVLIKHHFLVRDLPKVPAECADFAFDVSRSLGIDELLMTADVCVSDYSSLVFEYSLMNRPMVFFAPDIDDYCDWRGFYFDYRDFVPGEIVADTDDLAAALRRAVDQNGCERVERFRAAHMSACDGHSTDRLVEYAFDRP